MSRRYGWSLTREQSSPYSSMPGGVPAVTDDDFSYITSQDLEDPSLGVTADRYSRSPSRNPGPRPDDDVLLIKNKSVTYPAHFPAYAIGDGKLQVRDVKHRVGLMMGLSERRTQQIKLLYKGRQLKEPTAPVRDYHVKNNSELMAIVPEVDVGGSSPELDETVIVNEPEVNKGRRRHRKRGKKTDRPDDSASSPQDSNSNLDAPNKSPSPAVGGGSMQKLDDISREFGSKWLPLCKDYIASPPSDPKKREDEHRKLSESILQQIVLKLDGVETEGNPEVRTRRKELVKEAQDLLKRLDTAKAS